MFHTVNVQHAPDPQVGALVFERIGFVQREPVQQAQIPFHQRRLARLVAAKHDVKV